MPRQRARSSASLPHLPFEEGPKSVGRLRGQGSGGSRSHHSGAWYRRQTHPFLLRAAAPGSPFTIFIKEKKQSDKRKHPKGTPSFAFEALPWPSSPLGFSPSRNSLSAGVPIPSPFARLPTTSLNRPVHGLKSRDGFEFIECMMSLTRD